MKRKKEKCHQNEILCLLAENTEQALQKDRDVSNESNEISQGFN